MTFNPVIHHRRSLRLKGYDYAQAGAYFITICTNERKCLFGKVVDGEMRLNDTGRIVAEEWIKSAEIRREIEMDEWVVMPNHIHGIVIITTEVGAHGRAPQPPDVSSTVTQGRSSLYRPPKSLGSLIAGFKSAVTKRINAQRGTPGTPVWQSNYYEHIIRNEVSLDRIRNYIVNNPLQWALDCENPQNSKQGEP